MPLPLNLPMPFLVHPSIEYRTSYLTALREFRQEGRHNDVEVNRLAEDFGAFVDDLRRRETDEPEFGRVRETFFWMVEDGQYIGRVSIRHTLNARLEKLGGHIGYEIRPTKRKRGYGTLILALSLPEVRKMGIERALITCDSTNIGSRKIIEANGGKLIDETLLPGRTVLTRRYWIDVPLIKDSSEK